MKKIILALFILFAIQASAQVPDTVNNWSFYRTVGDQSATTSSQILSDSAREGTKCQSFTANLPANTYIEWRKPLDKTHITPFTLQLWYKLRNFSSISNDVIRFQFFLQKGDSLRETGAYKLPPATLGYWYQADALIDTLGYLSSFDALIVRFYFNPANGGTAEVVFDDLKAVYFHNHKIDSTVTLDRFGDDVILPVELTSFTGTALNRSAILEWHTATEVNNYGFDIERKSASVPQWGKIGFVEGSGTSNVPHDYSFTDSNLSVGLYSYRLKQINRDGSFEYSGIVEVTIENGTEVVNERYGTPREFRLANYPNPFNPSTLISFAVPHAAPASLKVYNGLGQEVATLVEGMVSAGEHSVRFEAHNLPSGVYFYRLTVGGYSETKRMILLR